MRPGGVLGIVLAYITGQHILELGTEFIPEELLSFVVPWNFLSASGCYNIHTCAPGSRECDDLPCHKESLASPECAIVGSRD